MGYYTGYEPLCSKCGKKLTKNETTGEMECLYCTYQSMDGDDVIEQPGENEPDKVDQEPDKVDQEPEQISYAEYLYIRKFQECLQKSSPDVPVTKTLVALNVIMYLMVSYFGNNYSGADEDMLMIFGANNGQRVFDGEWQRLITSMFLHGGIFHLSINLMGVWSVGNLIEKLFGPIGFFVIYFVSGVVGGVFSLYSHPQNLLGVGASGALCGIFGALLCYSIFKNLPKRIAKSIYNNAIFIVILAVVMTMSMPQIDNSAHIGGLLSGFIAAFFIGQDITKLNEKKRTIASFFVAIFCFIFVFYSWSLVEEKNKSNKDPRVEERLKNEDERITAINKFNEHEIQKENSVRKLVAQLQNLEISKEDTLKALETDYIRFFEDEGKRLVELNSKKYLPENIKKYIAKYIEMYNEYWQLIKKYVETSNGNFIQEANDLKKKLNEMRPDDF